jgi:ubiquinol-cytochrome c reductase iron-sulfur subunit
VTLLRRLAGLVIAGFMLLLRRSARRTDGATRKPPPPPPLASERDVRAVVVLLGATTAAGLAFVVGFFASWSTQVLGATLGIALLALAGAFVLAGARLAPQGLVIHPRPHRGGEPEVEEDVVEEGSTPVAGIPRRRLLLGAAGAAGGVLGAAAIVPALSLGERPGGSIGASPWRRGNLLVDVDGAPFVAADVALGAFLTAFPKGADTRELGSPVVVVRIPPSALRLPAGREDWAPGGILAFSKICTHAGCAIALFRYPVSQETSHGPALVCPCHYSTFDVTRGARVEFGPAVRSLPQLPLAVDAAGHLIAAGPLSGPVGPSWWGTSK